MSLIEEKFKQINFVLKCFEEEEDEFDKIRLVIQKKLNDLITKYALDYQLVDKNSVRELKFFSLISRIKEKNSLKEKFVRNNLFEKFEDSFNKQEIDPLEVKEILNNLDDIIGVKILTDLNIDCKNMYRLLSSSDFIKDARNEHIEFDIKDIKSQPQRMKNGLTIYKIKSKYKNYNFELQIKSKLLSSWGDMEHSIFYKDYQLTPVRDTAQQSMNHIGKLLVQIDEFLESIRFANANFKSNAQALLFINEIEEKYSDKIFKTLDNISFNFQNIAPALFNIKSNGPEFIDTENDKLQIEHFNLASEKHNQYIINRNKDFNLKVLESIVIDWIAKEEINQNNIDDILDSYLDLLITCESRKIQKLGILDDYDILRPLVKYLFDICLKFNCKNFFINSNKISDVIGKCKIISDIVESDIELNELKLFNSIFIIFSFHGDLKNFIDTNTEFDKDETIRILDKIDKIIMKTDYRNLSTTLSEIIKNIA